MLTFKIVNEPGRKTLVAQDGGMQRNIPMENESEAMKELGRFVRNLIDGAESRGHEKGFDEGFAEAETEPRYTIA